MWQNHATYSSQTKAVFEQYAFNPFGSACTDPSLRKNIITPNMLQALAYQFFSHKVYFCL